MLRLSCYKITSADDMKYLFLWKCNNQSKVQKVSRTSIEYPTCIYELRRVV